MTKESDLFSTGQVKECASVTILQNLGLTVYYFIVQNSSMLGDQEYGLL